MDHVANGLRHAIGARLTTDASSVGSASQAPWSQTGNVRSPPEDLDEGALLEALADGWGLVAVTARYAPLGAGSHHWVVTDRLGTPWFATVDDLDQKPWFGEGRELAWNGLMRAYGTALALRAGGLEFVVAPCPTREGEGVRRISQQYSVALFAYLDGSPGEFGRHDAAERTAVSTMLARLHGATPTVSALAPRLRLEIPGRSSLEAALRQLDVPWTSGPLSEDARAVLAGGRASVIEMLARADALAASVASSGEPWVITHGEPHGGNVMRTAGAHLLIDWDTVAIAPRERDLWMLLKRDTDEDQTYAEATGQRLDPAAVAYFRLRWDLADIGAFIHEIRSPHSRNGDAECALENLRRYLTRPSEPPAHG